MASRMDKYREQAEIEDIKRSDKNQDLYEDLYVRARYTEVSPVDEMSVDLESINKGRKTRESYHKIKDFSEIIEIKPKTKREELSRYIKADENKVYDINSILEEAKKNREQEDELERKRALKSVEYNILNSVEPEDVENLVKKSRSVDEKEELQELIDTITTINLRAKMEEDQVKADSKKDALDLLSDLIPNELEKTVVTNAIPADEMPTIAEPITIEVPKQETPVKKVPVKSTKNEVRLKDKNFEGTIDTSFYTRSMDLSDADFDTGDSDDDEKSKPFVTFIKILVITLLVAGIIFLSWYIISNYVLGN